jgi:hypothetical protein
MRVADFYFILNVADLGWKQAVYEWDCWLMDDIV